MPSLILSGETLRVTRVSERLEIIRRVQDAEGEHHETSHVPLLDIDRAVILGQPAVSIPALVALIDRGVPCCFLTSHGRWRASLIPDNNLNAARRIRQYEQGTNAAFSLRIARSLIQAKIRNCRRVLQRIAANRQITEERQYEKVMHQLKSYMETAATADTLDIARGTEGIAAALYFQSLSNFFPEDLPFTTRSRRPPRDAANALLSFGYGVLTGEVEGTIRSHGLDAAIGCLHTDRTNTPSLALDLMEPLRPAIIDLLTLTLVNHHMVSSQKHFEKHDDGGTYLNESGRHAFFLAYEQAMTRRFATAQDAPQTDLRQVIENQVCAYIRSLEQDEPLDCFLLP